MPGSSHHSLRRTGILSPDSGIRANIRLWQTALGATPTLLAMNSERRAVGKVEVALKGARTLHCHCQVCSVGSAQGKALRIGVRYALRQERNNGL